MANNNTHLLVVDDDQRLRQLLNSFLTSNGFLVTTASDAVEAREKIANSTFDLIVLDIMLPGESGVDFLASLRGDKLKPVHNMPILMLTAMGEAEHRISGLEKGADDYLAKPFEPMELLLRIKNILRRINTPLAVQRRIQLGNYQFNVERAVLSKDNADVSLTTVEANLLKILALNPGKVVSRDELALRSGVPLSPRTVDVQVTRLRRKIEVDPRSPSYIKTVRHKGYVLWPD